MSSNQKKSVFEKIFEYLLWNSRFSVILAVVFGVIGSLALFIIGSLEIYHTLKEVFPYSGEHGSYNIILIGIIGAIDLYLIGIVLLIFSFGIYELFISKLDVARHQDEINILDIGSLDELKNKILKVIVMVLIVSFFKTILTMTFATPQEMLYFALAIVAVAAGVFLIKKEDGEA